MDENLHSDGKPCDLVREGVTSLDRAREVVAAIARGAVALVGVYAVDDSLRSFQNGRRRAESWRDHGKDATPRDQRREMAMRGVGGLGATVFRIRY